ncbi:MAG TPA: hypothetical protein VFW66_13800 [Gemmatimonadales bacterium]|nr:hypothetical protein [Gemmatimonadales bacterium]
MPVQLFDSETGRSLGTLSDQQFQELADELEEESPEDRDYYLSGDTVDMMEEDGADASLVALLRSALAGREGADIRWKRVS